MTQLPPIKWAQRADSLYITIDVADIKNPVIVLDETHLSFRCVAVRRALAAIFWRATYWPCSVLPHNVVQRAVLV